MPLKQHLHILLRVAASLCMLSSAWQFNRFSNTSFSWLYIEKGFSETFANNAVLFMILILCLTTVLIWVPRKWSLWAAQAGSVVLFLEALAQTAYPPESIAAWNLPCHALRYLLPVALLLIQLEHKRTALKLLAVATGITFFGHGMKSLLEEMIFLDYVLAFASDMGKPLELTTGVLILHIIGTIDIALAHHICFFRWKRLKWILRYTALWGGVTAFARITYGGWGAWHEVTLRSPHFLVPLVLLLYVSRKKSKSVDDASSQVE